MDSRGCDRYGSIPPRGSEHGVLGEEVGITKYRPALDKGDAL